ncbi:hypothetical protein [Xylella fastidiosa]|uniref:hypothetical protein n=1 Tax=Xylella fastidiosa TaxID=2371 RepID=UPI00234C669F|nr:hypothetical protein [Xylella fastidiosa]MDC6416746.1 hypothetical protein [Xylella fastidiosa subsp. multiplex]
MLAFYASRATNAISDNERSKYSAEEMAAAFPKAPSLDELQTKSKLAPRHCYLQQISLRY